MASFRDLVRRARAGNLRSSEMTDPTITITNLGELGAESVFGLIYPPQVALVGFGRLAERPWVVDGRVEARKVIHASLAGDHRAVDGYRASAYLAEMDRLLQEPENL
jgi:pyruvate dehydrogenase E2 component (dihydrolipoamide acetyltransferase)